ncbi:MAG: hypothetical protein A2W01_12120 [Candidatus Solincola sediminis]|uniref:PrcB C-terminal domain-containing protein n=1 Tax=Candidatus Solincola sediminis TaxID=1797199 RepID=A0A1F2WT10_9ACTN|nr:MAG: hypothetical protein A2Y75_10345 [Candidatus Solincola sediminis]OFW60917.1 MAG: hypothetical protein A2W01_12120 [Candidatus Solincola sediminis]
MRVRAHRRYFAAGLLAVLVLLVPVAALQSGCGTDNGTLMDEAAPHDVGFSTIAQGVSSQYGRFDEGTIPGDSPPECIIITENEDYQRLQSLASFSEEMPAVDFGQYIVIAAMQGTKNTGGFAISIMHASQDETEVRVEVDIVEPEPGSINVQMLTSPYHLVKAERSSFDPRGRLNFTFVDQKDISLSQEPAQI